MPKRPLKISFRIPPYPSGRKLKWRRVIRTAAVEARKEAEVRYTKDDRLEVHVRLYMDANLLASHDVDNRAKDVLDALQGCVGRSQLTAIIPNDNQVFKLVIEKALPPKQSRFLGHVEVRRLGAS
jgi:Holliday junction resolvase RusA-like endonuclease